MRIAQRIIDSDEFAEWKAYDRIQPIRPLEDLFVILAQANWMYASANKAKNSSKPQLKTFLPIWLRPKEIDAKGDPDIIYAKMKMIAAMWD